MKSLLCSITGILLFGAVNLAAPGGLFAAATPMPSIKSGKWHFTARVVGRSGRRISSWRRRCNDFEILRSERRVWFGTSRRSKNGGDGSSGRDRCWGTGTVRCR